MEEDDSFAEEVEFLEEEVEAPAVIRVDSSVTRHGEAFTLPTS